MFNILIKIITFNLIFLIINGQQNWTDIWDETEVEYEINDLCLSTSCQSLCNTWKIDAVLNYRNGTILAFKGNYFWQIMNEEKPPIYKNGNIIGNYWKVDPQWGRLNGPINAAFFDDKGFTHLFKKNRIYTFKDLSFIRNQTVPDFYSLSSALYVDSVRNNESNVYLFKGEVYWKILPIKTNYDWVEISSISKSQDIATIDSKFPININAAFQDSNNNIILMRGPEYISIPVSTFPHVIDSKIWDSKFIFIDILKCEKSFYEKTFSNYDQFLIRIINKNSFNRQDFSANYPKPRKGIECSKSVSFWFYIIIGLALGICSLVLVQCLCYICKRESRKIRSFNNTKPKSRESGAFGSIDLIRQNQVSAEL